ncbi:MAG: hypothetical protein WC140_01065 [Bacteroidales bacterium]
MKTSFKTYKLLIPIRIDMIIQYLFDNIGSQEWSGILYYDMKGKFEDDSLMIVFEDMDITTVEKRNLENIMFSHNRELNKSFRNYLEYYKHGYVTSALDTDESLEKNVMIPLESKNIEDFKEDIYVSIAVSSLGDYKAVLARKEDQDITLYNLDIEVSDNIRSDALITRDVVIGSAKGHASDEINNEKIKRFTTESNRSEHTEFSSSVAYGKNHLNKKLLNSILNQLLSGEVLNIDDSDSYKKLFSKFNEKYDSRFYKDLDEFYDWVCGILNYLMDFAVHHDKALYKEIWDEEEMRAIAAYDISEVLSKIPQNDYIDIILRKLEDYFVWDD